MKIRILGCIPSKINFVCMPHEGGMKNSSLFAQNWMKITIPITGHLPTLSFVKRTPRVLFLPRVHCA